jgi:hypothetical protein
VNVPTPVPPLDTEVYCSDPIVFVPVQYALYPFVPVPVTGLVKEAWYPEHTEPVVQTVPVSFGKVITLLVVVGSVIANVVLIASAVNPSNTSGDAPVIFAPVRFTLPVEVKPVSVPTEVSDEAVTPEARVAPVNVPAAAVIVLVVPYDIDVPLIVVPVVAPVPPLATDNVPPSVIAPLVADDGVNPVVPPEKVETPVPDVKYVFVSSANVPAAVIFTKDGDTYDRAASEVRFVFDGWYAVDAVKAALPNVPPPVGIVNVAPAAGHVRTPAPPLLVSVVVNVALVTEPAVREDAVPVNPVPLPANPVEVNIPVEGINDSFVDDVFCGRLPVFAVTHVG